MGIHSAFRHMVPAADLVRNFGQWRDQARLEPVVVTIHGRRSHVIMGYDNFLSAIGDDDGLSNHQPRTDPVEASVIALFDSVRDCVVVVAEDLTILRVNHAASVHLRRPAETLVGAGLTDLFPTVIGSFGLRHLHRALQQSEPFSGDVPTPGREGHWLRLDIVPVAAGAAIIFRDVTDEVTGEQRADVTQSIIHALEVDGGVGFAQVSVRETVTHADARLLAMLGLTEEALSRVRFSTIIPARRRPAFATAIETVLAGRGAQRVETELLCNDGSLLPVRVTIVELRGAYASEGAVILVTPLVPSAAAATA